MSDSLTFNYCNQGLCDPCCHDSDSSGGGNGSKGDKGDKGDTGAQGPQGNAGTNGADGVSVTNASLSTNNLILTLSNASTINAGNVRGPIGPQGVAGGTFVGARARPTSNLNITGSWQSIPLSDADYDTESFISGNAFVIPANSSISYVEITAQVDARSGGPNIIRVLKNNVDLNIHHIFF